MSKSGIATLPLHGGKAPAWLFKRMVKLGNPIFRIIYDMEGSEGILRRLSDTYWFQGLACVLGFDWHSSGCTTVLGGVLKEILNSEEHGLIVVGGKGKKSLKVPEELWEKGKELDYSEDHIDEFRSISCLVAKIDNAAVQDEFNIYHHMMILSEKNWGIVQQGIDPKIKKARRYHWISEGLENYLENPHSDINTTVYKENVLDMAAKKSSNCRKASLDLVQEGKRRVKKYLTQLYNKNQNQSSIDSFLQPRSKINDIQDLPHLKMPKPFYLKWESLEMARNLPSNNYEDLLNIQGMGPGMIRALALISEFIWGEPPSWKDPAKYSFAVGGKDGIPYPVNTNRIEKCACVLEEAIDQSRLEKREKLKALKRLHKFKN
jgi:hypothetical protein